MNDNPPEIKTGSELNSRAASIQIQRAFRFLDGLDRHAMGVDHGGFHTGMTQEFLYGADIVTCLQEMGGKRVADDTG
jgi:hypothetical protein